MRRAGRGRQNGEHEQATWAVISHAVRDALGCHQEIARFHRQFATLEGVAPLQAMLLDEFPYMEEQRVQEFSLVVGPAGPAAPHHQEPPGPPHPHPVAVHRAGAGLRGAVLRLPSCLRHRDELPAARLPADDPSSVAEKHSSLTLQLRWDGLGPGFVRKSVTPVLCAIAPRRIDLGLGKALII